MKTLGSTYKGLITGVVMVLISLAIYEAKGSFDNNLQYITYAIYVAGIVWAIATSGKSADGQSPFKSLFSEGFKCFIVVSFIMVLFTIIFIKLHPGLEEQMAVETRKALNEKENYTPLEVDRMVQQSKDYYATMLTSMAVFGYLAIGTIVSVITAFFFNQKNK